MAEHDTAIVEMELNKIIINENRHEQIIVLKEKEGTRRLPIVIGLLEATAIKMELGGMQPPRPLTHDLLKSVIESFGALLDRIVIDKLDGSTFHAKLHISSNGKMLIVDARPSDSIALAVRMKASVFVAEDVLKQSDLFNLPDQ